MFHRVSGRLTGEDHGKLLSPATVGFAPAGYLGQARGDHAQDLVADVMAESIVESLEVVHIHNGNCVMFA